MRDYQAWRYHRDLPHFFRFHVRHLARVASEDEGLERDLSKAYDMIDHELAAEALRRQNVPRFVIGLCTFVWKGPRYCHVEGELDHEPIRPVRSLPQGESTAPGGMVATLVPWQPPSSTKSWAFMDDRSLTAAGPDATANLDAAQAYTDQFDQDSGFVENMGKRQR